jgi:hypothetical protein
MRIEPVAAVDATAWELTAGAVGADDRQHEGLACAW